MRIDNNSQSAEQIQSQLKEIQTRYKKVKRDINAWQKQFLELNGREAQSKDKKADATVKALYAEYKQVITDV